MTQNREIEAKTILSKTVYQNIVKAFPVKADFKQENYYFDTTKSLLKHHKIAQFYSMSINDIFAC